MKPPLSRIQRHLNRALAILAAISGLLAGQGCSPAAKVVSKPVVGVLPRIGFAVKKSYPELKRAETLAHQGLLIGTKDPERGMSYLMEALRIVAPVVARGPDAMNDARSLYNNILSRWFDLADRSKLAIWQESFDLPNGPGPTTKVSIKRPANWPWKTEEVSIRTCDRQKVSGRYFTERFTREGLGATLLATERSRKNMWNRMAWRRPTQTLYFGLTAVARFNGPRCEIELYDSLETERIPFAGRTAALAADLTAPLATQVADAQPPFIDLARLINPGYYAGTARMFALRPYSKERIPVVLVHGLIDTPATWAPLLNKIRSDTKISQQFQFWLFSYPSGYPYPYSASLLARELTKFAKLHPDHKPMILVGHSMGGLLSRLQVTDSGDQLWDAFYRKPYDSVMLPTATKKALKSMFYWSPRPDVGRVVFICTPHRGSELARSFIGRLGSRLVRLPNELMSVATMASSLLRMDMGEMTRQSFPTSIETLSPDHRFVRAMDRLPPSRKVPFHTILGDRGKNDSPNSSDGVVPYWSSHLDGARSEKIIADGHGAHQNAEAIAELHRILKEHTKGRK